MVAPNKAIAQTIPTHGLLLTDDDGNEIAWICAGDVDPTSGAGIPAPLGASYYRSNGELWRKTSAPNTGWQLSGLGDPVVTQTMAYGSGGNLPTNTWISRTGSVASNIVGVRVLTTEAKIKTISVDNENSGTYNIGIYSHDGNEANLTLLHTVSVVSALGIVESSLDISVAQGKQIAMRVTSGSVKNFGGIVVIKGTSV